MLCRYCSNEIIGQPYGTFCSHSCSAKYGRLHQKNKSLSKKHSSDAAKVMWANPSYRVNRGLSPVKVIPDLKACELCGKVSDKIYGSGRFCSAHCSRSYVSKNFANSPEKIQQKRERMKGHPSHFTPESQIKSRITFRLHMQHRKEEKLRRILYDPWEDLRNDAERKIRVFNEQEFACNICKIQSWMGKKLTFEMHHKDGNNLNTSRSNLEILCPNCHSQTPDYRWSIYAPEKSKVIVAQNFNNRRK